MQTSGARNTDPSRKNAHQYRPLTQALRDRGCRRDARERGGKRVDAQFTSNPKQPHGDKSEYRPLTQSRERVGTSPQEYRPLAQDSHRAENVGCGSVERWPRDLSAGAAAKEYRPRTQGREREGASPQEYRPLAQDSHRAENVGCGSVERWPRDLSAGAAAKEYRPLTQESAVTASKIQTFRARNTDLSRKGYRPFAQGITDRRRKELPTPRAKTAPNTDLSHK